MSLSLTLPLPLPPRLTPHQAGDLDGARACLHRHMQLAEALQGGTSAEARHTLPSYHPRRLQGGTSAEARHYVT